MLVNLLELYDCIAYSIIVSHIQTPLIPYAWLFYIIPIISYSKRSYPVILIMWQLDSRVRPGEFQSEPSIKDNNV
jgi:hypothetical protein